MPSPSIAACHVSKELLKTMRSVAAASDWTKRSDNDTDGGVALHAFFFPVRALAIASGKPDVADIDSEFGGRLSLRGAPWPGRLGVLSFLACGNRVIFDRHVTVAARSRYEQIQHLFSLAIRQGRTKLCMEPSELARADLIQPGLQRGDIPGTVCSAFACFPPVPAIVDLAQNSFELAAMTVVPTAQYAAPGTGSSDCAKPINVLVDK
jgi:hypothetical protein